LVFVVSAGLTRLMALSEVANDRWGANKMLPVAVGLILSLLLLIVGFVRHSDPAGARARPS
jgi:hypothetical protein